MSFKKMSVILLLAGTLSSTFSFAALRSTARQQGKKFFRQVLRKQARAFSHSHGNRRGAPGEEIRRAVEINTRYSGVPFHLEATNSKVSWEKVQKILGKYPASQAFSPINAGILDGLIAKAKKAKTLEEEMAQTEPFFLAQTLSQLAQRNPEWSKCQRNLYRNFKTVNLKEGEERTLTSGEPAAHTLITLENAEKLIPSPLSMHSLFFLAGKYAEGTGQTASILMGIPPECCCPSNLKLIIPSATEIEALISYLFPYKESPADILEATTLLAHQTRSLSFFSCYMSSKIEKWLQEKPEKTLSAEILLDLVGVEAARCERDWEELGF